MPMKIEDSGVSPECLKALKRVAFTEVEEVVEFFELHSKDDMILERWIPLCFDELMGQFKRLGYWTEKMGQAWPD
jgi:hypothetical protein